MNDIWLTSDQHFQHANILKFRHSYPNGELIRPGFNDVNHMDETMIQKWNSVVKQNDHVYCLGDIALGNKDRWPKIFDRLNGHKRLILGNHDNSNVKKYQPWFEKIMSWRQFGDIPGGQFVATHAPLHPGSFSPRKIVVNVHGHLHQNIVKKENGQPDDRYINICVEHTSYVPVHIDTIIQKVVKISESST